LKPRRTLVSLLEIGDGLTHVLVAVLLLLLAVGILVSSTITFVRDVASPPSIVRTVSAEKVAPVVSEGKPAESATAHAEVKSSFPQLALLYLSDLLLGVIVLELLSTILTYIHARSLEATIKDFLIVGLISSVRKILLIGAQSSLNMSTGDEFIKEALGTVISILGIILLIGGLLLLDRRAKAVARTEIVETQTP